MDTEEEIIGRVARHLGWKIDLEGDMYDGDSLTEIVFDPLGQYTPGLPETIEELMEYEDFFVF